MKYVDEYRDVEIVKKQRDAIFKETDKKWVLMEICGGQTHSIIKYGIDELLKERVELVHGPGCPVCVTPARIIDAAIKIAQLPNVIFCTFGDMLRVPGSRDNLFAARSRGADVRIVYSPLDALQMAKDNSEKEIVFYAIGFETTTFPNAATILQAKNMGLSNFSELVSQVLVPPAMDVILGSPSSRIEGFLAAGHVCTVMGYREYLPVAEKYRIPIVVTGFEPVDIMNGIYSCIRQLVKGEHRVENSYSRNVTLDGNKKAQEMINEVFKVCDYDWRGVGTIPFSGRQLNGKFADFDALNRFEIEPEKEDINSPCISGAVLTGDKKPSECPAFGKECTPDTPLGALMVSSEGACSAYYRYRK